MAELKKWYVPATEVDRLKKLVESSDLATRSAAAKLKRAKEVCDSALKEAKDTDVELRAKTMSLEWTEAAIKDFEAPLKVETKKTAVCSIPSLHGSITNLVL